MTLSTRKKKASARDLARVLHALGDPVRLDIVRQLAHQGEIPCGGFGVEMPKSSLSHHFRVLREAGILGMRSEGTSILNYLLSEELERRFPGMLRGILSNL
jgi:DNA-binding transcriptional ArsR family regulator